MNPSRKAFLLSFLSSFLLLIAVILAFLAGYLIRDRQIPRGELSILKQAHQFLLQYGYTTPPPDPKLEYGMIRGMLSAYGDPYTTFSEPAQHELTSQSLEGKFGGIGVTLGRDPQNYHVLFPIPESPAEWAGIKEGDRLMRVDELEITPETPLETIMAAVRGQVGETVRITIARPPDYSLQNYEIQRAEITLPSVTWYIEPADSRLGVLRINIIAEPTPQELLKAVEQLQQRGATHFALDLRDNGGGLLDSGIETVRLFLDEGTVIEQQYKNKSKQRLEVETPGPLVDIPLLVLVNQNTASAAEIIAGALQAHGRASLIGTHTFGKDTIQFVLELSDKSSLQVTTARWWIPGRESLSGLGFQADIPPLENTGSGTDACILAAIQTFFGKK